VYSNWSFDLIFYSSAAAPVFLMAVSQKSRVLSRVLSFSLILANFDRVDRSNLFRKLVIWGGRWG